MSQEPAISSPKPAKPSFQDEYSRGIHRMTAVFDKSKELSQKEPLLAEAREALSKFTYGGLKKHFAVNSPYSLEKEFYADIISSNAAAVVRMLALKGQEDAAKSFLKDMYHKASAEGFTRDRSFIPNRLDSRILMPMRNMIDGGFLKEIGFQHLDNALLCLGDCQTIQLAERLRDSLPLRGIDFMAYQHNLGSLVESGLADLFQLAGFFHFVNAAADYSIWAGGESHREQHLKEMRSMVEWLHKTKVRRSVFVTHVFFGVDNAVQYNKVVRATAIDAVTKFSDEVAAILSQAPNARLINFQEICPLTFGSEAFRDNPSGSALLHFRFEIMEKVAKQVAGAFSKLTA